MIRHNIGIEFPARQPTRASRRGHQSPFCIPLIQKTDGLGRPSTTMFPRLWHLLRRIFTIIYDPQPELRSFLARGQTQETPLARVTVAVLSAQESQLAFGVPLA